MSYIDFSRIDGLTSDLQRRVAQVIREIFPEVRLVRLESLHPSFNEKKPYALIHEPNLLPAYVISTFAESEVDERLIAWIVENNMQDPNSKASRLKILEMANKALNAKHELELMEEKRDMMKSMMASKKHEYRHGGKVLKK